MNLSALPAFTDNYIWMLDDGESAIVVDPGEAAPVRRALDERSLKLAAIVVTHHHADHVGGVDALRPLLVGRSDTAPCVWGPATEAIPVPSTPLREGDALALLGVRFTVIDVPGHTAGHIAFYAEPAGEAPLLFCGDTLFSGGCGRLFEGTPAQMQASLAKLAALPGSTRVCCAHEYTLGNLKFAAAVEPGNAALARYAAQCTSLRARGLPTLPSRIDIERSVNPFLRVTEPQVRAAAHDHAAPASAADDDLGVFTALRHWKNGFQ